MKIFKYIHKFLPIFIIGVLVGCTITLNDQLKDMVNEVDRVNSKIKWTNNDLKEMKKRLLIMSQQIGMMKTRERLVDQYDFESPIDRQYHKYIKINNSYSNPLSDNQIWDVVTELKNCENDPTLILAIAKAESSFNKDAVSKSECIGIMQINPIHSAKFNFVVDDLFDPVKSIRIADQLISYWQRNGKLSVNEICKKYLGCHSDSYVDKIKSNLKEL